MINSLLLYKLYFIYIYVINYFSNIIILILKCKQTSNYSKLVFFLVYFNNLKKNKSYLFSQIYF